MTPPQRDSVNYPCGAASETEDLYAPGEDAQVKRLDKAATLAKIRNGAKVPGVGHEALGHRVVNADGFALSQRSDSSYTPCVDRPGTNPPLDGVKRNVLIRAVHLFDNEEQVALITHLGFLSVAG